MFFKKNKNTSVINDNVDSTPVERLKARVETNTAEVTIPKRSLKTRIAAFVMSVATAVSVAVSSIAPINASAANEQFLYVVPLTSNSHFHHFYMGNDRSISYFCYNYNASAYGSQYRPATSDAVNAVTVGYKSTYNSNTELAIGRAQYYGYPNANKNDAYFTATQTIIWEILNGRWNVSGNKISFKGPHHPAYFYLNSAGKNAYNDITSKMIKHTERVSFNNATAKLNYNAKTGRWETIITDKNSLLTQFDVVKVLRDSGYTVEGLGNSQLRVSTATRPTSTKTVSFKKAISYNYKQIEVFYSQVANPKANQVVGLTNKIDPVEAFVKFTAAPVGQFTIDKKFYVNNTEETNAEKLNTIRQNVTFNLTENTTGKAVVLSGSNGSYSFSSLGTTPTAIKVNPSTGKASISGMPIGNYTLKEIATAPDYTLDKNQTVSITEANASQNKVYTFKNKTSSNYKGVNIIKHWIDENGNDYNSGNKEDLKKLLDLYKEPSDTNYNNAIDKVEALFKTAQFRVYVLVGGKKYYISSVSNQTYTHDGTTINASVVTNTNGTNLVEVPSGAKMAGISADVSKAKIFDFSSAIFDISSNGTINELPAIYIYGLTKETGTYGSLGVNGTTDGNIYIEEIKSEKTYANAMQNVSSIEPTKVNFINRDTADFYNYKKYFNLKVVKTDKVSNKPVSGATYGLYDSEHTLIEDAITENGECTFKSRLAIDKKYFVKEISSPDDYLLDTTEYPVKFTGTNGSELTVRAYPAQTLNVQEQPKYGELTITKKNEFFEGEEAIQNVVGGIKFTVTPQQDVVLKDGSTVNAGTILATLKTNDNGTASLSDIPLGKYKVKEIDIESPYVVTNVEQEVVFSGEETTANAQYVKRQVEFINHPQKGKLVVNKLGDNNQKLEGAKFKVEYAEDYVVSGKTIHSKGDIVTELVTDKNGQASTYTEKDTVITEYPLYVGAKYIITETEAPKGFELVSASKTFEFTYDKTVDALYAPTRTMSFTNTEKTGKVKVIKKTEGGNDLEVGFILSGTSDFGTPVNMSIKTDAKTGEAVFDNVPCGTYDLIEDATTVKTDIYVVAEGQKCQVEYNETTEKTFFNDELKGSIEITKRVSNDKEPEKDDQGRVLEGDKVVENIKFTLEGTTYSNRHYTDAGFTNKEGKLTFNKVPYGEYKLYEDGKSVPVGYLTADSKGIKLNGETVKVTFVNKPTEIEFSKKSVTGDDELPGARLTVFDSDNNKIAEWTSGDKPYILRGVLKAGMTYRLHEEIAPDGYLVANDIEFKVFDNGEIQHVVMIDKPTVVEFSKKAVTGGDELPGAKLKVMDSSGETIAEWTSTDKPYVLTGVLKVGETYTMHEDLAPIGYQKASDIKFKVENTAEVQHVEMIDEVIPKTGVKNEITTPIVIASVSLLGIALAFVTLKKKRNNAEN